MTRLQTIATLVAAISTVLSGCAPAKPDASVDADAALDVVARFIALDSAGSGTVPETSVLFMPCDARVTDRLEPVVATRVERVGFSGDSVLFRVSYEILGLAFSRGDASEVGARDWRFRFEPRTQVDTMRVVRDLQGGLRIACGPHYGNHPSSETLDWLRSRIDTSSGADWRRAQEAAARAGKQLP